MPLSECLPFPLHFSRGVCSLKSGQSIAAEGSCDLVSQGGNLPEDGGAPPRVREAFPQARARAHRGRPLDSLPGLALRTDRLQPSPKPNLWDLLLQKPPGEGPPTRWREGAPVPGDPGGWGWGRHGHQSTWGAAPALSLPRQPRTGPHARQAPARGFLFCSCWSAIPGDLGTREPDSLLYTGPRMMPPVLLRSGVSAALSLRVLVGETGAGGRARACLAGTREPGNDKAQGP